MKNVTPYVKMWYDFLEEGKIMALRCKSCGAYEFPPLPICNECNHYDMEWVEISGKGTLVSYNDCPVPLYFKEYGAVLSGIVKLDEGPTFFAHILGVSREEKESLFDRIPVRVEFEIVQRDGYKYPAVHLAE